RETGVTPAILHRQNELRIPGDRDCPRHLGTYAAQSIRTKKKTMHKRIVGEVPGVWVGRIDSAKGCEKLPAFDLQSPRQIGCSHERLFHFHIGFIVVVEFEDDVGEALKIGIDCTVESELKVSGIETALLGIVVTDFQAVEIAIARIGERELA